LALAALTLVIFGAYDSYPFWPILCCPHELVTAQSIWSEI